MQYVLPPCKIPTKEQLISISMKENDIRTSQKYIDMCSDVADEPNGWLRITSIVQEKLVEEEGFTSELEKSIALNRLRRANILYPDEVVFKNMIQVKNNLANKGKYIYGEVLPNLEIHMIDMTKINLYSILNKSKLNLLIASSHS